VRFDGNNMDHAYVLEKKYIDPRTGMVKENALKREAIALPEPIEKYGDFKKRFNFDYESKYYFIDTPVGHVKAKPNHAWEHLRENTYNEDRGGISGAFFDVLEHPLFVVKTPYKDTFNTVFYKPYRDDNGVVHIVSITVDENGNLSQKTFFEYDSIGKVKKLIKVPEGNLIYERTPGTSFAKGGKSGKTSHQRVERGSLGKSIAQNAANVKKETK